MNIIKDKNNTNGSGFIGDMFESGMRATFSNLSNNKKNANDLFFETAASNIFKRGPYIIDPQQKHIMAKVFGTETNVNLPPNHVFDTKTMGISTHKDLKKLTDSFS